MPEFQGFYKFIISPSFSAQYNSGTQNNQTFIQPCYSRIVDAPILSNTSEKII